jgi:hypothetical protein
MEMLVIHFRVIFARPLPSIHSSDHNTDTVILLAILCECETWSFVLRKKIKEEADGVNNM